MLITPGMRCKCTRVIPAHSLLSKLAPNYLGFSCLSLSAAHLVHSGNLCTLDICPSVNTLLGFPVQTGLFTHQHCKPEWSCCSNAHPMALYTTPPRPPEPGLTASEQILAPFLGKDEQGVNSTVLRVQTAQMCGFSSLRETLLVYCPRY